MLCGVTHATEKNGRVYFALFSFRVTMDLTFLLFTYQFHSKSIISNIRVILGLVHGLFFCCCLFSGLVNQPHPLSNYQGPIDATLHIIKHEGVKALFDGVSARILWLTPRLSIAVAVYDIVLQRIKASS